MKDKDIIEMNIADLIMERPISFTIDGQRFFVISTHVRQELSNLTLSRRIRNKERYSGYQPLHGSLALV